MAIIRPTGKNMKRAADAIASGGVVAFPTETVYGLGANALDPLAVARIFEIKNRPTFDPLIVHIAELSDIGRICEPFPVQAQKLADAFWPGPLTIVLQKKEIIPDIVTAGLDTVAVRMPNHPVAIALIRASGVPIAAPSANLFGRLSPTTADHVREQIGAALEIILDGGSCEIGVESTIIDVSTGIPQVLRMGGLALEDIEHVIGEVGINTYSTSRPSAPGQLSHHYAPRTKIRIVPEQDSVLPKTDKKIGLLAFRATPALHGFFATETLSGHGDLREAAARLFECLHRLDNRNLDEIYAQAVPETGLGRAIMDRLRRASFHG